jgi:hypothetical protein
MSSRTLVLEAPEAGTIKIRDLQVEVVVEQQVLLFEITVFDYWVRTQREVGAGITSG